MGLKEELAKLVELLESKQITQNEFDKRKAALLRKRKESKVKKIPAQKKATRKSRPAAGKKLARKKGDRRQAKQPQSPPVAAKKSPTKKERPPSKHKGKRKKPPSAQAKAIAKAKPEAKVRPKVKPAQPAKKRVAKKSPPVRPAPKPKHPIGSYRRLELLGKGFLARAFHARSFVPEKMDIPDVLLKLLHVDAAKDSDIVNLLKKTLSLEFENPNLVVPFEFIKDGNKVALVTPLIKGEPLAKLMGPKVGPLSLDRVEKLFLPILDLVEEIHQQKVTHFNLKPENIFIVGDKTIQITDFGVDASPASRRKQIMKLGPIDYKAPEYVTDDKVIDHRVDIYSLGLILYEMLAGRLPWDENNSPFGLLMQKEKGRMHLPSFYNPSIPNRIEKVINRAIRVDPNHRFVSIEEFREALLNSLAREDTQEIALVPIDVAVVSKEEKQANKAKKLILLIVLLSLAGGGGWAFIQYFNNDELSETIHGNGYTAKLVSPGSFPMGCPPEYSKGCDDDNSHHEVTMPNAFYMMQSEVTQSFYAKVMSNSPSQFVTCGEVCPVEMVSWYKAVKFANVLSEQEGLEKCYEIKGKEVTWRSGTSCTGWRLPTEAEWEYAARGGSDEFTEANPDGTGLLAGWVGVGMEDGSVEVCQNDRNDYGLCDMGGNVFEWVWDEYAVYKQSPQTDPIVNEGDPENRVLRGGAYGTDRTDFPVFWRGKAPPETMANNIGFRLCRTYFPPQE